MKKIDYKGLQLDVFYEKLDNGLEVFVLPKKMSIISTLLFQLNMDLTSLNLNHLIRKN